MLQWIVFSFFIFFTFFSVLNIVTGVFVDGAIQQANDDRSLRLMQQEKEHKEYVQALMDLLFDIDADGSGYITREEWDGEVSNWNVQANMLLLGVNGDDADRLFNLLDTGGDGVLSIPEFVEGMQRLKGPAQSIDVHVLISRVDHLIALSEHVFKDVFMGQSKAASNGLRSP